jgi:tRNA-uridine 2-sulfurtransferase
MNEGSKKAFVGMSGGVDSSVSAALLQRAGYDVTGVFIKAWHPEFLACSWRDDRRDAMAVCARLGIPFETCDLEEEYKRDVVDYLIREYAAGRTPNPDVMCNQYIKFGAFFRFARACGADVVATGHYARSIIDFDGTTRLFKGVDPQKDQSYFSCGHCRKKRSRMFSFRSEDSSSPMSGSLPQRSACRSPTRKTARASVSWAM